MTNYQEYVLICRQIDHDDDDILSEDAFMDQQPAKQVEMLDVMLRLIAKRQQRLKDRYAENQARGQTWGMF